MNNKSSQPEQQISKVKSPAFIGSLICFIGYIVIIGLGYAEKLSEKWIGWIDIACLVLGLITYIADTSGFLEKKPTWLPAARTITLATISLSLSIHIFTQTNMLAHFPLFVSLACVLIVVVVVWAIKAGFERWKGKSI